MKRTQTNRFRIAFAFAFALLSLIWSGSCQAQQLDEIIKRGKLIVAIDLSSPPFGSQDKDMKPAGYDVDIANMLAKDLGVQLEIVPVNSANRIPYLLTKRVDFVISSFTITPERAKSITFSIPYCALSESLTAAKSLKVATMADLAGKKISVARGTTNEMDAVAMAPPTAQVVRFDDEASAQAALVAGQVDAYVSGGTVTKGLADRNPQLNLEDKLVLRWVYSGIGMRRGDADLARWVDIFVMIHRENGDIPQLYQKWFGTKLPGLPTF